MVPNASESIITIFNIRKSAKNNLKKCLKNEQRCISKKHPNPSQYRGLSIVLLTVQRRTIDPRRDNLTVRKNPKRSRKQKSQGKQTK